jgi:opacity protein-like surface antigen
MIRAVSALALLAASCTSVASAGTGIDSDHSSSTLDLHIGIRSLDDHDWQPVDDQAVLGIEYVHEPPESTVGLEFGFFASESSEDDFIVSPTNTVDARSRTRELTLGVHKYLPVHYEGIHPYLGGGLSLLRAEVRGASGSGQGTDDDGSAGLYLHGGVEFDLSANFFLGVDLRFRGGNEVELFDEKESTGYSQVTIVLGLRW